MGMGTKEFILRLFINGKEVWLKRTPSGLNLLKRKPQAIYLKDIKDFLNSAPETKALVEQYLNNPPSRRIDRLTRMRVLALWLFASGKPFRRKEVNRVIRVFYEHDPPLSQDVPRIAQEILDCPAFEKLGNGYWKVIGGELKTRGRPPKPDAPSATEAAFSLLLQKGQPELHALARQGLRRHMRGIISKMEGLIDTYEFSSDRDKARIIKETSNLLDSMVNIVSLITDSILLDLFVNGLITETELRRATKRVHSTTIGSFISDIIRFMDPEKEQELNRLATEARKRLYFGLRAWKEGKLNHETPNNNP